MNHHTPERHLVVLETTFQDQCFKVKIKIKKQKRGTVRRHECLLHFSWIYTHSHTPTYSPVFQPVWCDRINQLASWGGKCGETALTAGLLCRTVDVQCIQYIVDQCTFAPPPQLLSAYTYHCTFARCNSSTSVTIFTMESITQTFLHFCEEFHDMNIGVQYFKEQGRLGAHFVGERMGGGLWGWGMNK